MAAILVFILRLILVLILFSFLGWTIFTLWRDLRFQSQILLAKVIPPISLISDQDSVTENFSFTKTEFTIGRDPSSDIRLADEIISSRHCRIYFRNSHWWVEDMLSTNGTYLNEERLETPTILISGDEIRFGSLTFKIEIQTID
jgi:pSer/pThr/pTyr-binding forkhead associated (FHA) protein